MGKFEEFIAFHHGVFNRILHLAGFAMIGLGIFEKSLLLVITGAVVQELGHVYQYLKTRDPKDNPLRGLKAQSIFAIPLFILIIIYVVIAK